MAGQIPMHDHPLVTGKETMSSSIKDAHNYHRYLCSLLLPHLGKKILEIGPGYGQYTKVFHEAPQVSDITVADIDAACLEQIQKTFPDVTAIRLGTEGCAWPESLENKRFDSVILINVLEHMEDDGQALKNIFKVLVPGGNLLIIVPAHAALYGQMDALAGHYRRYEKAALAKLLDNAGFLVEEISYINPVGGLGWYINAKFTRPPSLSTSAINSQILFFDKYLLPLSLCLTPCFKSFFGQSLWCRAIKPAS